MTTSEEKYREDNYKDRLCDAEFTTKCLFLNLKGKTAKWYWKKGKAQQGEKKPQNHNTKTNKQKPTSSNAQEAPSYHLIHQSCKSLFIQLQASANLIDMYHQHKLQ